jgi:uncharacterized phage-associated protein
MAFTVPETDASAARAVRLADRVLVQSGHALITHLKLQKLTFYTYGAILAERLDPEVGQIEFEAWKHGPVSRAVNERYKWHGAEPLPVPRLSSEYGNAVERCIGDVLAVYGKLSAWQLREQSHLEDPWKEAWSSDDKVICVEGLRRYFSTKFAAGHVTVPEVLTQVWPLSFDRLPQAHFESLHSLASAFA